MKSMPKIFVWLHIRVYRATGGRIGGRLGGGKCLLLTTIGNQSGQPRTVPLMYFEDQGRTYIVGSFGGAPGHPAWYKNLSARSAVTVEMGSRKFPATATTVDNAERDPVFAKIKAQMPVFATYEQRAVGRQIPIVRIDPQSPAS